MTDKDFPLNPFLEISAEMNPTEFEKYCMEILKAYAEKEKLIDFSITHNEIIKAHDGEYQIDVYAEFTALNVRFKVLTECKKYSSSVERKIVAELQQKLISVGAHKGIIISTAGFQSGASLFAKEHGIALIQIMSKHIRYVQNNVNPTHNQQFYEIQFEFHKNMPDYFGFICDESGFPMDEIYPTPKMITDTKKKIMEKYNV